MNIFENKQYQEDLKGVCADDAAAGGGQPCRFWRGHPFPV